MQDHLPVIQSNYLTSARYDYSVTEKRIIYHAIAFLQSGIRNGVSEDIFGKHLCFTIPIVQLKLADPNDHLARDYKKASISLRKKDFLIEDSSGWINTGFINYAQFHKGVGLEIEVSKFVLPYLYELAKGFTAMSAMVALTLQSKYAQRFYEWCCRYNNKKSMWFEFTPDSLSLSLGFSNRPTSWIKQKVIETAQNELKGLYDQELCDLYFTYEEERGGRGRGGSVKKWRFRVHSREDQNTSNLQDKEAVSDDLAFIVNYLKGAWAGKTKLINNAVEQAVTKDIVKEVAERLQRINVRKVKNIGGLVRDILSADFDIEL